MSNLFSLTGKLAVITGGGSGIGKSISKLFSKQGAFVVIIDNNVQAASDTLTDIKAAGGEGDVFICDIACKQEVDDVFNTIGSKIGNVQILVNNAGIAHIGNLEKTSEEDFDRIYSVNVKGVYNCLQAVIPQMKSNKSSAIVNLASIASSVGIADRFAYSMSKGAVLSMTLSIAKDYIQHNIRCNCISPGRVHTPFVDNFLKKSYPGQEEEMFEKLSKSQPIGRMGTPDEIASLALYLSSDEAGFVTGSNYAIDGGFVSLK
jgi:2-keto-3-deoxy-L-fuconate dehydrogenase